MKVDILTNTNTTNQKPSLDISTLIQWNNIYGKEKFDIYNNSLKILELVYNHFKNIKIASSFGLEDVVLIDLTCRITEKPIVFFLDTGRLHKETYQTVEEVKKRYNIELEIYFPDNNDVEKLVREKGFFSFYESIENRKECCYIRKVKPLKRALNNVEGWITGLRSTQSITRIHIAPFELDIDNGNILKVNPLFNWGWNSILTYVQIYKIPYNPLHDKGYPSIGCEPCTRAIQPGEDIRAGRWWWEKPEHKECGLHKR